jgi:adenosylcobyric acid synthase
VWGTYLHGVFEDDDFRRRWLRKLGSQPHAGEADHEASSFFGLHATRQAEYDRLADVVEAHVDMPAILRLMGLRS